MTDIHKTAVVEEGAQLGSAVSVGPYTVISSDARIEDDTTIGPRVTIEGNVRIGPGNQIMAGAVIGTPPQDVKYDGAPTEVRIGSDNIIREYVTINRATTSPDGATVLGDENMIMSYCHIAHDCELADGINLANCVTLAGHVTIQEQVMIGGLTPVHQFVRIGAYAMVSGLTALKKDVIPYIRVAGSPAEVYDLNSIGLRRAGFSAETRRLLKQAFKILYRRNHNTSQALAIIEEELPRQEELSRLIEFIRNSERGIHK